MIKVKYQTLTKEEKNKIKKEYYSTTKGKELYSRFKRLGITIMVGYLYSFYLIYDLIFNKYNIGNVIIAGMLFIASSVFLIGLFNVRLKSINNYVIKKK